MPSEFTSFHSISPTAVGEIQSADRSESHQEHEGEDNEPILVLAFDEQINQHQQEQDIALVEAVQMEHPQKAIQVRHAGE